MDLHDWLDAECLAIQERGDPEPLRMIACYAAGFRARERDPDFSYAAFREARAIAERLQLRWWAMYFAKMCLDARMHFQRDFRDVLDQAVQAVLDARKPENASYPGRHGLWDALLAAYLGIDSLGYARSIQEALDYLEGDIDPAPRGPRYLLLARQRVFAIECDRWQDARDLALRSVALGDGDSDRERAAHFGTFTAGAMCAIAAHLGDWAGVATWASTTEELARQVGHQSDYADALAWQGLAAQQAGEVERGRRLQQTAVAIMSRLGMPGKQGYFEAVAQFRANLGDLAGALAIRDAELAVIVDRGRPLAETRVRLQRCELLARLNRLPVEEVEAVRAVLEKLRKPEGFVPQVERLAEVAR